MAVIVENLVTQIMLERSMDTGRTKGKGNGKGAEQSAPGSKHETISISYRVSPLPSMSPSFRMRTFRWIPDAQ